jgi:hypothetical protein
MTDEGWQRILRIMDEVYADYLSGMAAPRKRVVGDVKRKLTDSKVLDGLHLERSAPAARERPAAAAQRPHTRGRRKRRG